jgi:hypothetical protein
MENNLFDWVIDQRDRGFCVTQGMIRCEALRMLNGTNFQASNGWFSRFLRRKRLVVRRITTSGRDLPKDAGVQANTFLDQCHEFVRSDFDRDTLLNGDETSIYLDPPTRQTYAEKGSKRVEAITTGQQKTRISVCFTATASGTKLKPLILIPRKKPIKNWVPPNNVELVYGSNGNFNETIICEHYIPKILVNYKNQQRYQGLHLVFDQAPCHTTQKAKSTFTSASVDVKWVPKRMTAFLQPADQSWMRPLKVAYFKKWNDWLVNAPKSYTAAGNMRSPGYAQAVLWISEVWAELDASLIASSFQFCGITTRNLADFSSQLRHFVRTTELVDEVQLADDEIDENQFIEYDEDGLYPEIDAIMDSESDQDEHED